MAFSKSKFLSFMTKVNPNNGNEIIKLDIFPWDIFKSHTISFLSKDIKVFQWLFQNRNFSALWWKLTQQWKWNNKIRRFSMGHIQIWHHTSLSKNIKVFQWLIRSKFVSFMTTVNPNNRNETKSNIFPWDIFTSDTIPFLSKKYLSISMTFKIKRSQF